MAKSNVIWAEFAGHGFVAGPFSSSVISGVTLVDGDVYTVTFLWTNIYTDANILIDNVGARMYVEGYSNRDVPDGYYTITDAAATTVTITGKFSSAPSSGAPTGSATLLVEDFFKFCDEIPDFVQNSGTDARSRWLEIIPEDAFSFTLGQTIDVRGGVSSFDGFSLSLAYYQSPTASPYPEAPEARRQEAFRRLVRIDPALATDDGSSPVPDAGKASMVTANDALYDIDPSDTTITQRSIYPPDDQFMSTSPTGFGFLPLLIDREAMIVTGDGFVAGPYARTLPVIRGLLDTATRSVGYAHLRNSIVYDGLQTGQAANCRIRSIEKDALTYDINADYSEIDSRGLVYSGIVENIKMTKGISSISLELSPQIFSSQKNSFGEKLSIKGVVERGFEVSDRVFKCESRFPELPYKWVKVSEDIILRLRQARNPTGTNNFSSEALDRTGAYLSRTYIDHIVWDPDEPDYNQNYIIISPSSTDPDFRVKSRSNPKLRGTVVEGRFFRIGSGGIVRLEGQDYEDGAICKRDTVDGLYNRAGTNNRDVIWVDMKQFDGKKAEPCHVFESSATGYGTQVLAPSSTIIVRLNEILMQILTSVNGDGANGPFDVLPSGLGLAIDQTDIDWASFGWDYANGVFNNSITSVPTYKIKKLLKNVFLTSKDSDKIKKWVSEKLLQPQNLIITQRSNGKIALSDTVSFEDKGGFTEIFDEDLEYEANSSTFTFDQFYDSSKLFDRVLVTNTDPGRAPSDGQSTSTVVVPSVTVDNDAEGPGSGGRVFTFIQSEPLKFDYPFIFGTSGDSVRALISADVNAFTDYYSNILPLITFVSRSSKLEVGEKFSIFLDQAIAADGARGFTGTGIVINKRTNLLGRQAEYQAIITAEFINATLWSASGLVQAGSSINKVIIANNQFTDPEGTDFGWTNDGDGFNVGDYVVLYDENFVMLSVDAGGNADPRAISGKNAVGLPTITLASPFTDGAGANITAAAGQILMLGQKALQTDETQSYQSFFADGESVFS